MSVRHKTYRASEIKAGPIEEGTFEALVSVFGNVDMVGDRVVKGAFGKSLARWAESGDPIPVIWAHQWNDLSAHLGEVLEAEERDEGLWIKGQLDMDDPDGRKVWRKLKSRLIKEFSFAYDVVDERRSKDDGANELLELELLEVGPCLKGINPDTQLLAVKAAIGPHGTGTSEDAWDGPANEARLSTDAGADTYRRAYAWVDPDGDADTKAAYRFIHHEISAERRVGAANVRACLTAIGVLNGGRGGTTIPDADRRGVYNHLSRHLRDADREPPELRSLDGDETKDGEPTGAKAGRVLSAKNEQALRQAVDLLSGVLKQLDAEIPADEEDGAKDRAKAAAEEPELRSAALRALAEASLALTSTEA